MATKVKNFRDAYQVLQGHAETLRRETEPNIDDLLNIVQESVEAYKVCKERIDAVEKALQQTLTDVQPETSENSARRNDRSATAPAQSRDDELDDDTDIPF